MTCVRWSKEDMARLERWYVEEEMEPRAIAKRLGVTSQRVKRKIWVLGLAAKRSDVLIAARRRESHERAYAARVRRRTERGDPVWSADRVAELERLYMPPHNLPPAKIALRFGFDPRVVRRKITDLGLAARRRQMGLKFSRVQRIAPSAAVVRLQPGAAAGVTAWESALVTASPPKPQAANDEASARARRGALGMKFHYARRGGGGL